MQEGKMNESRSVSLVEALNWKYSPENCVVDDFAHIQLSSRVKEKTKGQALLPHEKRETVTLECCGISVAGNPGEIARVCPQVSELDLTGNHIKEWREILSILSQLKFLQFLNLCGNPLENSIFSLSDVHSNTVESGGFASLTKLVLNSTKVSLSVLQPLLKFFSSLLELHLSLNGYSCVPEYEGQCTTVKRLHFNGNNIKLWNEVEKLGNLFPNLETLIIMENPLTSIERDANDSSFLFLKCLSLTKTMLASWEDVEALRNFVSLNEVKLLGVSLLAKYSKDEARRLLVARLPNIVCLNGTPVSSTERENAERHFIRKFQTSKGRPRRYDELIAIHGELDPLAEVNMGPIEYAEVLVHVTGKPSRLRSVSLKQTTDEFRKDMARMLKVPYAKICLHYKDQGSPLGSERMNYKDRHLYRYRIKDGDEIFVDIVK